MKKYKALLVIVLLLVPGVILYLFLRMGANDAKALADFQVAYRNYDQAISDYAKAVMATRQESTLTTDGLEQKINQAFGELNLQASIRISSLTKHDSDLMQLSLEIADLARNEAGCLKRYQSAAASKDANLEQLVKQFDDLTNQRHGDYARYLELAGIKN